MENGWILLHRKLIDTSFYKNPRAVCLAVHILLKSCHKGQVIHFPGAQKSVVLRRGQYLGGYKRLGSELGWHKSQIRRATYVLENAGFLTREITTKYCIITLNNYNSYQGSQCYQDVGEQFDEGAQVDTPKESGVSAGSPGCVAGDTKLSAESYSHTKKVNTTMIKKYIPHFEELWLLYPNKVGKKNALRHCNASVKNEKDFEDIKTALKNYKNSKRVADGYIQDGSVWFNNWQDWISNPTDENAGLEEMNKLLRDAKEVR